MKPDNVQLKDWLVSQVSEQLGEEEDLCNKVIGWTYLKTKEAMVDNKTVEISGFGKFLTAKTKITKRINLASARIENIQKLMDAQPEEVERNKKRVTMIAALQRRIDYLKTKLREDNGNVSRNMGRVEERPSAS